MTPKKPLFKIFDSPKKEIQKKEIPPEKIDVDYREKQSLVPTALIKLGIQPEFKELKIGDYLVKGIAVERKTVSDFISSMINRRLTRQLEELQQYPSKLLIVEGIDEQELYSSKKTLESGMHPNSIRGFLLSILLRYNVPIIFTKNPHDTAIFISLLAKKKKIESPLNVRKKARNKKEQLQFVLESFPGVGPKTAKKLLEKFKTLQEIFNSSLEELQEILGKKAEIFSSLLHQRY